MTEEYAAVPFAGTADAQDGMPMPFVDAVAEAIASLAEPEADVALPKAAQPAG